MQKIVLSQCYNESLFIERWLTWIYPLVDRMIITEGRLTPFGALSERSIDGTADIIRKFIKEHDKKGKIIFKNAFEGTPNHREQAEGTNKNYMLKLAEPEDGDLIIVGDIDEFYDADNFNYIINKFRQSDKLLHTPIEEWQMAYNMELCFKSSHGGRFLRYRDGAHFGHTNHFYVNGKDVTRDYTYLISRERTNMCHLCWVKHPRMIKEKCISFNRGSFQTWFNFVYLEWPFDSQNAYKNNKMISPYHGCGFAEGMHEPLRTFQGTLPDIIQDLDLDWIPFIKEHSRNLAIPL